MLLGGSIAVRYLDADQWVQEAKNLGFRALTWPEFKPEQREEKIKLQKALKKAGITIAEVGAWRNTLDSDEAARRNAIRYAAERLAEADEIGARCCVNIAGSTGEQWDGPYRDNYSAETYEKTVDTIREIIDMAAPTRSFYTIEPMPWMVPDGPDEYLQLLRDVDRSHFGVHLDFVNMINTPCRYLMAEKFLGECLRKLGKYIKSCHHKDCVLEPGLTTLLREVPPGKGKLDHGKLLALYHQYLPADMPVLLEHMNTTEEYRAALAVVRSAAEKARVPLE